MKQKQVWVSHDNKSNEWRVHTPGAKRDIAHTETKASAFERAREVAINQHAELKVQNMNGKI